MLYLVKIDNSHLKIGYSTNVASRIKSFQTSSLQVELLAIREGDECRQRFDLGIAYKKAIDLHFQTG